MVARQYAHLPAERLSCMTQEWQRFACPQGARPGQAVELHILAVKDALAVPSSSPSKPWLLCALSNSAAWRLYLQDGERTAKRAANNIGEYTYL